MSRIIVQIDRLVLPESVARNQAALVAGLKADLSRTLSDHANQIRWAGSRRLQILRLGRTHLESGPAGGRRFGRGLAQRIGKALMR
jgi:hypothetical protein